MVKTYLSDKSVGDSLSKGWKLMGAQLGILLLVVLISGAIQFFNGGLSFGGDLARLFGSVADNPVLMAGLVAGALGLGFLAWLVSVFVINPIKAGVDGVFLTAAYEKKLSVGTLFSPFRKNYLNTVGGRFLSDLIIGVGFVLLIIPGIIFAIRLSFVNYLLAYENLSGIEAIKESWERTKGYGWTIFGFTIAAFFISIAGVLLFGIGFLFAVIWIKASFAVLYMSIMKEKAPAKKVAGKTVAKKTKKTTAKKSTKKGAKKTAKKSPA